MVVSPIASLVHPLATAVSVSLFACHLHFSRHVCESLYAFMSAFTVLYCMRFISLLMSLCLGIHVFTFLLVFTLLSIPPSTASRHVPFFLWLSLTLSFLSSFFFFFLFGFSPLFSCCVHIAVSFSPFRVHPSHSTTVVVQLSLFLCLIFFLASQVSVFWLFPFVVVPFYSSISPGQSTPARLISFLVSQVSVFSSSSFCRGALLLFHLTRADEKANLLLHGAAAENTATNDLVGEISLQHAYTVVLNGSSLVGLKVRQVGFEP